MGASRASIAPYTDEVGTDLPRGFLGAQNGQTRAFRPVSRGSDVDRPSLAPTGLQDSLWRVDTKRGFHVYGMVNGKVKGAALSWGEVKGAALSWGEIKGENGYVVAPVHEPYKAQNLWGETQLPFWDADFLTSLGTTNNLPDTPSPTNSIGECPSPSAAWRLLPGAVHAPIGERHATLKRLLLEALGRNAGMRGDTEATISLAMWYSVRFQQGVDTDSFSNQEIISLAAWAATQSQTWQGHTPTFLEIQATRGAKGNAVKQATRSPRNAAIVAAHNTGASLLTIGELYGLSVKQVRRIILKGERYD